MYLHIFKLITKLIIVNFTSTLDGFTFSQMQQ